LLFYVHSRAFESIRNCAYEEPHRSWKRDSKEAVHWSDGGDVDGVGAGASRGCAVCHCDLLTCQDCMPCRHTTIAHITYIVSSECETQDWMSFRREAGATSRKPVAIASVNLRKHARLLLYCLLSSSETRRSLLTTSLNCCAQ